MIIPTFNRRSLLAQTLQSVFVQTFEDYEIIVVDDGSTDGTLEWLASNGQHSHILSQSNSGPGSARNLGIREAQGEYIAFLDSDDLWFPWTLETFAEALSRFNRPAIVAGEFVQFTNEAELDNIRNAPCELRFFFDYFVSSREPLSLGSGVCVFSRQSLVGTYFLEDRLNGEDHDLFLRLGTQPGFVKILGPPTLAYRRHGNGETAKYSQVVAGMIRLLDRERSGAYPGGGSRAFERHRMLARHARPVALACLREGSVAEGIKLYCSTFLWNLQSGHWSFSFAFPLLALAALFRGKPNLRIERR